MSAKKIRILIMAISLFLALMIVLFLFRLSSGPEDLWICEEGEWIKHGNPDAPMPETGCSKEEPMEDRGDE